MPEFPKQEILNLPGFVVEPDEPDNRRVFINDPKQKNDIQESTKLRIGQYMSDLTKGEVGSPTHPNRFTLDRNQVKRSITDPTTGRPVSLSQTQNSQFWIDRQSFEAGGISVDANLENPEPAKIGLGTTWQRGESTDENIIDGHDLLRVTVNETGQIAESSPISQITSAVLSNKRPNLGFVVEPDDPTDRHFIINDPEQKNDIQESTKLRIGQYMSDLTEGKVGSPTHPNRFTLDRNQVKRSITDSTTGRPVSLSQTQNSQFWIDRQSFEAGGISVDTNLENPEPTKVGLGTTWQHGESTDENIIDGHDLLRVTVNETGQIAESSPISQITSAVLSNNRFNSDLRMNATVIAGGRDEPTDGFNPTIRLPNPSERVESLGQYNRGTVDTNFNNLAKIGLILSLRGTGEIGADSDNYNPLSAGEELKAILPSTTQLGTTRPSWESFRARDIIQRMDDNTVDGILTDIGSSSWGVMNNVYDPFDGITASGTPILAYTLILTMIASAELLSFIVDLIAPGKPINAPTQHSSGRFVFGQWQTEFQAKKSGDQTFAVNFQLPKISEILGITETQYPFGEALRKGTYLFFGIDRSILGSSGLVAGAIGSVATSFGLGDFLDQSPSAPGYNAVFCRAILRSTVTIIDSFKTLGSSPNFIAGFKNFLAIFEVIKRSKLISAINIFTQLGDLALTQGDQFNNEADGLHYTSEIDAKKDDDPSATISKSKLQNGNKLAWAGNRAPSYMLMPSTVFGMSVAIRGTNNSVGAAGLSAFQSEKYSKNNVILLDEKNGSTQSANRIPSFNESASAEPEGKANGKEKSNVDVRSIEESLESEYVPFYFHDIRTNEIVSFHAFLNSLTEDFSPSWESTEGYGRIDPISIYKSTARRVNFSFWIVSTGHADFQDMWVKLNKLVTLIYPQYTQGRKLNPKNYNFTMPFSQIPSASPIIRLRIGDLIRSNYSKFNLSRVFGLNDKDTEINGKKVNFDVNLEKMNKVLETIKSQRSSPWAHKSVKFGIKIDGANIISTDSSPINVPIPMVGDSGNSPAPVPFKIPLNLLPYFKLTPVGKFGGPEASGINISINLSFGTGKSSNDDNPAAKAGIFSIEPMTANDIVNNFGLSQKQANSIVKKIKDYSVDKDAKTGNAGKVKDRKFIIPVTYIDLLPEEKHKILAKSGVLDNSAEDAAAEIWSFMQAKNNAIVKSFEDTGGMGLACRIDSLSFDWLDQVTWETVTPGEKAPSRVKVTMAASVIHDISPGIDHLGYNRAPIYPIGVMNTKIDR